MGLESLALMVVAAIGPTSVLASNLIYLGTLAALYGGLAYGASALSAALTQKPSVPKPEDGSYNLKQNVPSLSYILGRDKKAGDYAFLEESGGTAFHIIVQAGHRIQGYVQHYLHDKPVTLDGSGVVSGGYVQILTRLGLDAETAYADVVSRFPTIWTNDHRGDGLATIRMSAASAGQKEHMSVYPNQMPQPSSVMDGALLFDPRNESTAFSRNIALMRFWHLTHPVGGKMAHDDMYWPEWAEAADVCDETVFNRDGDSEERYHGGLWFRGNSDQVEVGRLMDQAAELVVYERPDGLVGVHAGRYVEPDIRLTRDDIISLQYDANTRDASTVLAVRGRFVDPGADYNTADAAIWGDPYVGEDTERTKTVDNQVVKSHNHIQRMQKIAMIRANAPRVSGLAHYEPAKNVPYRRFIRMHMPPKLDEAVIEITSSPKLSLRNLTIEFSGIVIPEDPYDFDAAIEEGEPPPNPEKLAAEPVPLPENFNVTILTEVVAGGATAAYAKATWDIPAGGSSLSYEFEWQPTSLSEEPRQVLIDAGKEEGRSSYLADGDEYRFRIRSWGNGTPSAYTSFEIRTATADPVAPGVVTGAAATGGSGQANYTWVAPNSANYAAARLYVNTVNSFSGATLVGTEYGPPNIADGKVVTGLSAGLKYGFIVAINASGTPATAVATGSFTVT